MRGVAMGEDMRMHARGQDTRPRAEIWAAQKEKKKMQPSNSDYVAFVLVTRLLAACQGIKLLNSGCGIDRVPGMDMPLRASVGRAVATAMGNNNRQLDNMII